MNQDVTERPIKWESGALGLPILTLPQAVCMTEGIKSHLIQS